MQKTCEYCQKIFEKAKRQKIGRFCSRKCREKVLRKEQLAKYNEYTANETEEQRMVLLRKKFDKFVVKNIEGCWSFNGSKSSGYGHFIFKKKLLKAHRASWILHKGPIPKGLWVLHKCDNRECSNPDHLFLGNNTDNMRDMASKHRTGVRCKLTLEQVYEIKKLLNLGVSSMELGRKYNVSDVAIHNIKHGITWKRAA